MSASVTGAATVTNATLNVGQVDPNFANVSLLLHGNGTNGSTVFTDNSPNNFTVTPNGNAQIDTTIKKYGTGSIELDGNEDYLTVANNSIFNFSNNDFTIEFWMFASSQALAPIVHQTSYASNQGWIVWNYDGSNVSAITRKITFMLNGVSFVLTTSSDAYVNNTWTHIAIVKTGTGTNNIKIYSNGVVAATGTYSTSLANTTNNLMVGGIINGVSWNNTVYFNGYLDDIRITKGVARYTANFTPPSTQFPDQ
jgi:hypothetical protein